jgi:hypothetical protein
MPAIWYSVILDLTAFIFGISGFIWYCQSSDISNAMLNIPQLLLFEFLRLRFRLKLSCKPPSPQPTHRHCNPYSFQRCGTITYRKHTLNAAFVKRLRCLNIPLLCEF